MLDLSKPDTPLTPEQQKRKKRRQSRLILLCYLGVLLWVKGPAWFEQIVSKAASLGLPWPVLVLGWILSIPILNFIVILIHESGHGIGAVLTAFRVRSFTAGYLHIERKAAGWKVHLRKIQVKLGGMVQAYPAHSKHLRRRFTIFVAAGPAATLLSGSAALLLRATLQSSVEVTASYTLVGYVVTCSLFIFGWLSIMLGILNLLPLTGTNGYINDGSLLRNMFQGGAAMHQQLLLLQLSGESHTGVRPRLWDGALVENLLSYQSNSVLDCHAHCWAYHYFHDHDNLEKVRLHLNEALDRKHLAPVATQQYLFCEAAYIAALHTHNVEQARHWLKRAQQVKPFTPEEGLFSRAAVAWAEGHLGEAQEWLQAARKHLSNSTNIGFNIQAAEQMDDLQAKLQEVPLCPEPA
ncbi:MAG TPA: M50 family metallopeptidase [Hymenobacter sp.]|jgi:hypothetical protein